jgi:hypothetical protein
MNVTKIDHDKRDPEREREYDKREPHHDNMIVNLTVTNMNLNVNVTVTNVNMNVTMTTVKKRDSHAQDRGGDLRGGIRNKLDY